MRSTKLAIVIHAEEEFDWNRGFNRANQKVTHHEELICFVNQLLNVGAKVTLAMDYPFVISNGGQHVINYFKDLEGETIEFATHLHPWVNPPFEDHNDEVDHFSSYPGNLDPELEFEKIKHLTEEIERVSNSRPVTYLAGRYGLGPDSAQNLSKLGYKVDLSISAYCDFRHQQGPDFSQYSNTRFTENQLMHWPHTCSVLSAITPIENYFNRNPRLFTQWQSDSVKIIIGKLLRLRRYRLSPEGFIFKQLKRMTQAQLRIGQQDFVFSLHSPSVKPGLTPYVNNPNEKKLLTQSALAYVQWFSNEIKGEFVLPKLVTMEEKV